MTSKSFLSQEKVQQLLTAVGSVPSDDAAEIEVIEYNWGQPHYFNNEQLEKLNVFADKIAANITKKFAVIYNSDFTVTVRSITQHFANELLACNSAEQACNYHLAFEADDRQQYGFVTVPAESAIAWVTPLLGDSESKDDAAKNLSQLEESLLLDIAATVIKALSSCYNNLRFHPAAAIVKEKAPCSFPNTEELCQIGFEIKQADSEKSSKVNLSMLCRILDTVTGKTQQDNKQPSPKDISQLMRIHIEQVPVLVTTKLASTMLTFEEIMDLQPSDVVLLEKNVGEPAELIVQGKTLFHGQIAKSGGKYAVVITETCKA